MVGIANSQVSGQVMTYEFRCIRHGLFEVKQPMASEHKATCWECGAPAQRIFSRLEWVWAGSIYRPDGSLREVNDYASLKG